MSLRGDTILFVGFAIAAYVAYRWLTSSAAAQAISAWAAGTWSGDAILPNGTPNPSATTPLGTPISLPYSDPQTLDQKLKNSLVTGIIPDGVTRDQWIAYQTTGALP